MPRICASHRKHTCPSQPAIGSVYNRLIVYIYNGTKTMNYTHAPFVLYIREHGSILYLGMAMEIEVTMVMYHPENC